jgi:hypothetical protein
MGYMVEVTLDDFDDWSILEAAEDIIGCYDYKEGCKEEKLLREMYKHLCEMFDEDSQVNPETFVGTSTAAGIIDDIHLKTYVEESKDFKFFADI